MVVWLGHEPLGPQGGRYGYGGLASPERRRLRGKTAPLPTGFVFVKFVVLFAMAGIPNLI